MTLWRAVHNAQRETDGLFMGPAGASRTFLCPADVQAGEVWGSDDDTTLRPLTSDEHRAALTAASLVFPMYPGDEHIRTGKP